MDYNFGKFADVQFIDTSTGVCTTQSTPSKI